MTSQRSTRNETEVVMAGGPNRECDACVIGGGVTGAAIAYFLGRAGKRVVLVERGDLAAEASGVSMGWVCVHFATYMDEYPAFHMRFMRAGLDAYDALDADLKAAAEYRQAGGMSLVYTRDDWTRQETLAKRLVEQGIDVRMLSREEAMHKEPALAGDFLGAIWSPREGLVTAPKLVAAFVEAARRSGAQVLVRTAVEGIVRAGDRVAGVETTAGRIEAPAVVNAAGVHAPAIGGMAGLAIPMFPNRGQQIFLAGVPGLLHGAVYGHVPARPMPDGRILLGGIRENAGFDNRVTLEGVRKITSEAAEMIPALKDATFLQAFAGLRPVPRDGLPILGRAPGVEGFYLANLHFGVTLAPLVGRVLAELITTGQSSIPVEEYSLARFARQSRGGCEHEHVQA
jgi:sarcosine oxidase subunit beta